jgi:hypothetical protein
MPLGTATRCCAATAAPTTHRRTSGTRCWRWSCSPGCAVLMAFQGELCAMCPCYCSPTCMAGLHVSAHTPCAEHRPCMPCQYILQHQGLAAGPTAAVRVVTHVTLQQCQAWQVAPRTLHMQALTAGHSGIQGACRRCRTCCTCRAGRYTRRRRSPRSTRCTSRSQSTSAAPGPTSWQQVGFDQGFKYFKLAARHRLLEPTSHVGRLPGGR